MISSALGDAAARYWSGFSWVRASVSQVCWVQPVVGFASPRRWNARGLKEPDSRKNTRLFPRKSPPCRNSNKVRRPHWKSSLLLLHVLLFLPLWPVYSLLTACLQHHTSPSSWNGDQNPGASRRCWSWMVIPSETVTLQHHCRTSSVPFPSFFLLLFWTCLPERGPNEHIGTSWFPGRPRICGETAAEASLC